ADSLDRNRDAWRLVSWAFCHGGACRAWILDLEFVLAVRGSEIFDPCVCDCRRGCAVQPARLLRCNARNDSLRLIPSATQAKAVDRRDRQARSAERSSRSSTRTRMEGNLKVNHTQRADVALGSHTIVSCRAQLRHL